MSDITLKTAIRVNGWANTAVRSIQKRYENKDRGQTAFEYLGIILVVVAIIGAIMATGIGGKISTKIGDLVDQIKAGGS
ncbi:Flp family type IVb pilin [Streptomyces sp. NPDC051286]|uniref:Flp family type IVb pilin n=1 Tax=Streptomyces sp. NPDC051286 TaxID=3365647 RepID=UPI00378CEC90